MALLTGFEPYLDGVDVNPSWEIVRPLDGEVVAGFHVRAVRLPVAYGTAVELLERIVPETRPVAIVCFGMCREPRVRLERRFRFAERAGERLEPGEPPERATALPVDAILAALRAHGFTADPSDDAGLYVCEHVGFVAMGLAHRRGIATAGFVHVPDIRLVPLERQLPIPRIVLGAIAARVEA